MTNREKLNQMSNEELSELLSNMPCGHCIAYVYCHSEFPKEYDDCYEIIKKWLAQEVEE